VKSATQRSAPSDATSEGPVPTAVLLVIGKEIGVAHWFRAARRLPRFNAESCVLVTNAAICSLGTLSEGLYVVGVVPFVRPEKYASAISQKKMLLMTSVKGTVIETFPHVPVSAGSLMDVSIEMAIVDVRIRVTRSFLCIDNLQWLMGRT
jgi:hypothetical protein